MMIRFGLLNGIWLYLDCSLLYLCYVNHPVLCQKEGIKDPQPILSGTHMRGAASQDIAYHVAQGSLLRSRTNRTSKHRITNLWASYQIRKIADCACAGNARSVFPHRRLPMKPLVSDPSMHHGTCVPCRDACRLPAVAGKTFPAFPAHAYPQSNNGERFSMTWRHDVYATRVTSAR